MTLCAAPRTLAPSTSGPAWALLSHYALFTLSITSQAGGAGSGKAHQGAAGVLSFAAEERTLPQMEAQSGSDTPVSNGACKSHHLPNKGLFGPLYTNPWGKWKTKSFSEVRLRRANAASLILPALPVRCCTPLCMSLSPRCSTMQPVCPEFETIFHFECRSSVGRGSERKQASTRTATSSASKTPLCRWATCLGKAKLRLMSTEQRDRNIRVCRCAAQCPVPDSKFA